MIKRTFKKYGSIANTSRQQQPQPQSSSTDTSINQIKTETLPGIEAQRSVKPKTTEPTGGRPRAPHHDDFTTSSSEDDNAVDDESDSDYVEDRTKLAPSTGESARSASQRRCAPSQKSLRISQALNDLKIQRATPKKKTAAALLVEVGDDDFKENSTTTVTSLATKPTANHKTLKKPTSERTNHKKGDEDDVDIWDIMSRLAPKKSAPSNPSKSKPKAAPVKSGHARRMTTAHDSKAIELKAVKSGARKTGSKSHVTQLQQNQNNPKRTPEITQKEEATTNSPGTESNTVLKTVTSIVTNLLDVQDAMEDLSLNPTNTNQTPNIVQSCDASDPLTLPSEPKSDTVNGAETTVSHPAPEPNLKTNDEDALLAEALFGEDAGPTNDCVGLDSASTPIVDDTNQSSPIILDAEHKVDILEEQEQPATNAIIEESQITHVAPPPTQPDEYSSAQTSVKSISDTNTAIVIESHDTENSLDSSFGSSHLKSADVDEDNPIEVLLTHTDPVSDVIDELCDGLERLSTFTKVVDETPRIQLLKMPSATKKKMELPELLELCKQSAPISFEEALTGMGILGKLGEATYSEVYGANVSPSLKGKVPKRQPRNLSESIERLLQGSPHRKVVLTPPTAEEIKRVAVKVMPFRPSLTSAPVDGFEQMSCHDIAQEILITHGLSGCDQDGKVGQSLPSFVELVGVAIVQGKYPEFLLDEWDLYDDNHESENERPDKLPDDQLYVILTLSNGGPDLEHTSVLRRWAQARSMLQQLLLGLAAAERLMRFEHRDLHWGNVLIDDDYETINGGSKAPRTLAFPVWDESKGRWVNVNVPGEGIKVTVIDFTLSRCEQGGRLMYVPMEDEDYFTGDGDLQFDIYRMMRKEIRRDWAGFYPKTNVMWVYYMIDKLLKNKASLPKSRSLNTPAGKDRQALVKLRDRCLEYTSVSDMVQHEIILPLFHASETPNANSSKPAAAKVSPPRRKQARSTSVGKENTKRQPLEPLSSFLSLGVQLSV